MSISLIFIAVLLMILIIQNMILRFKIDDMITFLMKLQEDNEQ